MTDRGNHSSLQIAKVLFDFVNNDALPGTGIDSDDFWSAFSKIIHDLAPVNRELLSKRDAIQEKLDNWHKANPQADFASYKDYLLEIGYLLSEGDDFHVYPENVDEEIATIASPQLVVHINNARFS